MIRGWGWCIQNWYLLKEDVSFFPKHNVGHVIHQSFVSTGLLGPGNFRGIYFFLCRCIPSIAGTFLWSVLCQKREGNDKFQNQFGHGSKTCIILQQCGDSAEVKAWQFSQANAKTSIRLWSPGLVQNLFLNKRSWNR